MPKGVEHPKHSPLALLELRVEIPQMPKGVEHIEAGQKGFSDLCGDSSDAERR